jgi:hypothetical protein
VPFYMRTIGSRQLLTKGQMLLISCYFFVCSWNSFIQNGLMRLIK